MSDFEDFRDVCEADAEAFGRIAWDRKRWSRQAALKTLMRTHPRVWAKGGHSTGKTNEVAYDVIEDVALHPGAQTIIVGATYESARDTIWSDIRKAHATARIDIGGEMNADRWTLGDGWFAKIVNGNQPETLHGVHGERVRVIVDEASALRAEFWPALDSLLASQDARLVVMFNPIHAEHRTREIVNDPSFRGVTFSCEDHPNVVSGSNIYPGAVTREWVEAFKERVRRGLATQDDYRARVLGEFPLGGDDQLVSESDLEAVADGCAEDTRDELRIGLDVARFGSDRNVLVVVDRSRRVVAVEAWVGADLMQTTGRLIAAIKRYGVRPEYASVDVCGIGAGVVDRCREQGVCVASCDFGVQPVGDWAGELGNDASFLNRRAELHMLLRVLIRSRRLSVPREYREMWSDLCVPRFKYTSSAKQAVESKDEIRKRVGRSPDYSDALIIALNVATADVWIDI